MLNQELNSIIHSTPLEITDPELAQLFMDICHKKLLARVKDTKVFDMFGNEIICSLSIGRNDPCICGSNIKFKKCCGKT